MSLAHALREACAPAHAELELLPFFTALHRGELPLRAYREYLVAVQTIVGALEHELTCVAHTRLTGLWSSDERKEGLLKQDLRALEEQESTGTTPVHARLPALELVSEIRRDAFRSPVSLAGYLYVFRGSSMGAAQLLRSVAGQFGFAEQGVAYLNALADEASSWKQWKQALDRIPPGSAEFQIVLEAGVTCFAGLVAVVAALPTNDRPWAPPHAIDLNPNAGFHSVATEPLELEAALRAGDHSLTEFPYLELRYGGRGRRFTASDSAWLVSICDLEPDVVEKQILWLAGVLAARGMPRLLLEEHLHWLYEESCAVRPERSSQYALLLQAAGRLKEARLRAIAENRFAELVREYESRVPAEWLERLRGMGRLLVGAMADERAGIRGSADRLADWVCDRDLFPEMLVQAATRTLADAAKG